MYDPGLSVIPLLSLKASGPSCMASVLLSPDKWRLWESIWSFHILGSARYRWSEWICPHFTQLKDCWVLPDIENQNRTMHPNWMAILLAIQMDYLSNWLAVLLILILLTWKAIMHFLFLFIFFIKKYEDHRLSAWPLWYLFLPSLHGFYFMLRILSVKRHCSHLLHFSISVFPINMPDSLTVPQALMHYAQSSNIWICIGQFSPKRQMPPYGFWAGKAICR